MAITYFSAGAASQLIKNSNSNGNGIMCKIENKEFAVNWINCNNKTFSAERKGSGGYQEFEKYTAIEQDRFFYKRY